MSSEQCAASTAQLCSFPEVVSYKTPSQHPEHWGDVQTGCWLKVSFNACCFCIAFKCRLLQEMRFQMHQLLLVQAMFVVSAGPGVVSTQVEVPGLSTEYAHILCHLHNCGVPGLLMGETILFSSMQPPWLLLVCFPEGFSRIKLNNTLCLCSSSNAQPWELWRQDNPKSPPRKQIFKEFISLAALSFLDTPKSAWAKEPAVLFAGQGIL